MRAAEPSDAATHGKYQPARSYTEFVYGLVCIRIGGELSFTERHVIVYGAAKCDLFRAYGFLAPRFGGRPRFKVPAAMSQSCSLQFGQRAGLPAIRLIHSWPQRRHSQIILRGI